MHLVNFDAAAFLRETWQRQPLLIRNPWDSWLNPLEPDNLAGLACEPGIESRLITQSSEQWELEHGPLPADRFGQLGKMPWTLLVQAVDHHVPSVAELLEPFRFIPSWRIDDIMVSYAVDGGGVGAHFDNYDVFLIQGLGQRRWQVGARCDQSTPLLPHDDLRLLADFEPTAEWILEPGDILYVPPGFAHNGIAVGDGCMTYSIGFRAPSRSELIADWTEHVVAELDDDDRYCDPGLVLQDNPGEISRYALARLQQMVAERVLDRAAFDLWFGEFTTTPKEQEIDWRPEQPIGLDEVRLSVAQGAPLLRNPASRFSFIRREVEGLTLFVNGQSRACSGPTATFAEQLCAADHVTIGPDLLGSNEAVSLLLSLLAEGSVAFEQAN